MGARSCQCVKDLVEHDQPVHQTTVLVAEARAQHFVDARHQVADLSVRHGLAAAPQPEPDPRSRTQGRE